MGGYVFAYVGRYRCVCEQLPGANSSSGVTKLSQSYSLPLATGDEVIKFLNVKVMVGGGGMRSTERSSSSCFCLNN